MSVLFPLGMAALGALVPLVILYLLKQKRIEEKVPANFLWARALEDLRASSLFQRFRAPLLFLLQAAAVILCALAAAGASLDLDVGSAPRRLLVLIDRSASMKAGDDDGRTRFDAARDLAKELIDGLTRSDEMMLVAFDSRAEVVQAFTPDAARLRDALDALAPRDLPTRIADALELATSFARASRGFEPEIVILSDGCVEEDLPAVPFPVRFAKVGTSGANQGIAGLSVSRAQGEKPQVLVRLENGEPREVRRTVVLSRGEKVVDAREVELPAGTDVSILFEVADDAEDASAPAGVQRMAVSLEGADTLSADDRVQFLLRPVVARNGLLVRNEASIHLDPAKLSRLRPGLLIAGVTPDEAKAAIAAGEPRVDLVCYDGVPPDALPDVAAQVYVGCLPPGAGLTDTGTLSDPIILDWSRTHPVTTRCQFDDVFVLEAKKLSGTERSLALVESTGGPLVLLTPVPGREVLVVAFDPSQSNLPLKVTWPLFLANALDHLLSGVTRQGEEAVAATGTSLPLDAGPAKYDVTTPTGAAIEVAADPAAGTAARPVLRDTVHAGIYSVRDPGGRESLHAFALLDGSECHVAPRDRIELGTESAASDPAGLRRNLLLRDPLLLAVLAVLLLEWAVWCGRR